MCFSHLPEEFTKHLATILTDILNCRFSHLDTRVLLHKFATTWGMSRVMRTYRQCARVYRTKNSTTLSEDILHSCVGELQKACDSSKFRVIKTIRIGVHVVPKVFDLDPDVNVIHYTRDPRGTVVSRQLVGGMRSFSQRRSISLADGLCRRMRDDLTYSDKLLLEQPQSFTRIRYEDLAFDPTNTTNIVYKSIGMETPSHISSWIKQSTSGKRDNGGMGTLRTNSTEVATKWRRLFTDDTKSKFLECCSDVINHLGYM